MKNKAPIYCFILVSLGLFLSSCEKISGPYRKPVVVTPGERKVLIEDFTGHQCGFCPEASKLAYEIKEDYGDRVVVMAIHAGFFARLTPPKYTYDFKCPEGVQLDTDFGISAVGNPNGMINRKKINGSYIISKGAWAAEVENVLNSTDPLPVRLNLETEYDSASRNLNTTVQIDYEEDLLGPHRLSLYLVEDSIIKWQKDYSASPSDVENYVHREVLRGSINGTYGDLLSNTTDGNFVFLDYNTNLKSEWVARHMSIVAVIFNETTKEILQVEQKHLE
ncbi:MAG: Omp28 family outer membrane lipoprotein [Bacteroidota bacterium]|jgi:thiol-disulfide isomerase/thioredoxin